jgi:hypothetical protein
MPLYQQIVLTMPNYQKQCVPLFRKLALAVLDGGGSVRGVENHGLRAMPTRLTRFVVARMLVGCFLDRALPAFMLLFLTQKIRGHGWPSSFLDCSVYNHDLRRFAGDSKGGRPHSSFRRSCYSVLFAQKNVHCRQNKL